MIKFIKNGDPVHCPSCQSIYYRKNGKNPKGIQRFQCYDCGCTYTKEVWKGYPLRKKEQAIKKYLKGDSGRKIEKGIGIPNTTISCWVRSLIKNLSEINQVMNEFDFCNDDLGRLKALRDAIGNSNPTRPVSIQKIRELSSRHLNAFLLLIRHRPKQRKKSKNSPSVRCAKMVNPPSISTDKIGHTKNFVRIGKRKVKMHVGLYS